MHHSVNLIPSQAVCCAQDIANSYNAGFQVESEMQAGHQKALATIYAAMEAEFAQMQACLDPADTPALSQFRGHNRSSRSCIKLNKAVPRFGSRSPGHVCTTQWASSCSSSAPVSIIGAHDNMAW